MIRFGCAKDAAAVYRLICALEDAAFPRARFDQLHHCARIAEIMELAVEEGCRGRGIGTVLFDRACALSAQAGCVQIELSCSCARHDAHRFYARKGMCLSHRRYIKTLK